MHYISFWLNKVLPIPWLVLLVFVMSVVTIISIQKALHRFRAQANTGRKLTSKGRTEGKELTQIELGDIRTRIEALEKKKEELLRDGQI